MTREMKIFEMAKAIAPVIVQKGIELQERISNSGGDPAKCMVGGKSIPEAYAESIKYWSEIIVIELEK